MSFGVAGPTPGGAIFPDHLWPAMWYYNANLPLLLPDYADLRQVAATQITNCYLNGNRGMAGMFSVDPTDTTSADNGGTIIVDAVNRRWKRHYAGPVSILWFIPKAEHAAIIGRNSTFDCHDAIMNAINSAYTGANFFFSGSEVYFPAGRYRVNSTINITRQTKLLGTTGAVASNDGGSELSFPAGVGGIITNSFNTNGLAGITGSGSYPDPTFSSAGSVVEGLRLIADTPQSGPTAFFPLGHPVNPGAGNVEAHGIRMRGMCLIRNCFLFGFEGNGINIVASATAPAADPALGNDNLFRLEGVTIQRSALNGVFVDLADVNAGSGYNVNVVQNGLYGIFDSSFLGNTWVACHANSNFSGDYKTDNVNASSVFLNCYSEAGFGPSTFATATLVVGGALAGGIDSTSGFRFIQAGGSGSGVKLFPAMETGFLIIGIQNTGATDTPRTSGYAISMEDSTANTGSNSFWRWNRRVGSIVLQKAGVGEHQNFYDSNATVANGYARNNSDAPSAGFGQIGIGTHFFGTKSEMKYRGLSTVAPTTGEYLRGDIIWSSIPAAAGKMGWSCTTGGTAGSTAVFKQFGAIDP
jgi:hypothetical protein